MEKDFREQISRYREKLRKEMNLPEKDVSHFRLPVESSFSARERMDTTILFGGLTPTHEIIIKGALEGLGYKAEYLPTPDRESLSYGKEFCSRGQCNPTYFTVGNLIKYLSTLRNNGVQDIEDRFVFLTVGSCGPCRFGMYEAEYRKALKDAGFERFRVIIINQSEGISSRHEEMGIRMDIRFFLFLIKGLMVGDLINEIRYRVRPYEREPGSTEKALQKSLDMLYHAFKNRKNILFTLREARRVLEGIDVDYLRVKPKVKILGEFWAQTTEGDGNYRLPGWLEEEGCQVLVEPVSGWLDYLIWFSKGYVVDRIKARKGLTTKLNLASAFLQLKLAGWLLRFHYNLYRWAIGFVNSPLPSQDRLAELSSGYYSAKIAGGEGHLEVAKNLMVIKEKNAHLVISVKPFGCMPSTQSDGVQSRVMSVHKDGLFIPIETSGDGEVNVKSRVQMKLHEAKEKAREEFDNLLKQMKLSHDRLRDLAEKKKGAGLAMLRLPSRMATTAGNYVLYLSRKS